jgi:poly(3-hydroxybutyrate) depolymerase
VTRALALAVVFACGHHRGGAVAADAGADATADAAPSASRCTATGAMLACTKQTVQIGGRTVTYQLPLGTPPASGWPIVIYYQGSFVAASHAFAAAMSDAFGQYQLTETVKALLDRGYAVIAPETVGGATPYWETNVPPYATSWTDSPDDVFVHALVAATADGTFGPLDASRTYAMGISSGGFMTSRMAVSYAGTFRALAIASASYATCSNICSVPALPADHPATLFLHGAADAVVPVSTMYPYRDALAAAGRDAQSIVDPTAGHQWLAEAVTAVPDWFDGR